MSEHSISLPRWIAKKYTRIGVASASTPLLLSAAMRRKLRVLTYHRFADEKRSPFAVTPSDLERQMAWLKAKRLAVGAQAVGERIAGSGPERTAVLVTMDDGDPSVFRTAAPVFEKYAIPYVVYVVPGRIGRNDHMTRAQIRELSDNGAEIGSHTTSHRSVTGLSARDLADELVGSKKAIEDITGKAVKTFAYPFGTRRDYDDRAGDALRVAGYDHAFTSQHGAVEGGSDPMFLPRVKIEGGDPFWLFKAACIGAMDQWRLIDAGMSGFQKPEAKDTSGTSAVSRTA